MIAEWLYRLTSQMGGSFNNAVGLENEPYSNLLSGIMMLWEIIVSLAVLAIVLAILLRIQGKEEMR